MPSSNRILNDWIGSYLDYTENSEAPRLYRKWTAISCVASALQRKCSIAWGTGITWYPNMYIILVGPSAARKGTAMGPGLDILESISNVKIAANATSLQALIKRLKETNHNDADLTTGELIFHASMTIFSKEFTVFLGYQNNTLISALCDWYDCDRQWKYETISRQTEEIVGVWVNLIGATTPDLIRLSLPLETIGGGLTSRIIFVVETKKAKSVPCPQITQKEIELKIQLTQDLEKISLMAGAFTYTPGFISEWTDWYIAQDNTPPDMGRKFEGYLGRRATHVMKLSMIHSASRRSDLVMTDKDFKSAIITLEEVETNMTNVFKGVGKNPDAHLIHSMSTWFLDQKRKTYLLSEIVAYFEDDADRATIYRTLNSLKTLGTIHFDGGVITMTKPTSS